jgi:hypothetical protein
MAIATIRTTAIRRTKTEYCNATNASADAFGKRHENVSAQSQTNSTREYGFDEGEKLENADGDSNDKTSSNTKQRARLPVTAHERG